MLLMYLRFNHELFHNVILWLNNAIDNFIKKHVPAVMNFNKQNLSRRALGTYSGRVSCFTNKPVS